jgi:hypothetical protein
VITKNEVHSNAAVLSKLRENKLDDFNDVGEAYCSKYGGEERCIEGFGGET